MMPAKIGKMMLKNPQRWLLHNDDEVILHRQEMTKDSYVRERGELDGDLCKGDSEAEETDGNMCDWSF